MSYLIYYFNDFVQLHWANLRHFYADYDIHFLRYEVDWQYLLL